MKALAFEIALKIANDNNPNTVLICTSILKEAFIVNGVNNKDASYLAIDAIKIIMKSMLKCAK